jgi:hypothetical protein
MKTLALRARVFIHCFLVFGYPSETLALVVHILLQNYFHITLLELILGRLRNYKELMPSEVDLDGALKAIARIQETYHLPPSYITAGLREMPMEESQLGIQDTYTIGRDSYYEEKYYNTKIWMEEAFRQMNGSSYKDGVKLSDILDHLSWVEFKVQHIFLRYI